VLVTRPAGQQQSIVASLEASGCTVFHQPLLELQPLDELGLQSRQHIVDLDLYQQVIFISGNAVRFGMEHIENYWPQLPVGITWYAVGETTARLLEERGITAISPEGDMSSEGLLALPGLQSVDGQRLLIVKGEGGREALRAELRNRGAKVDTLNCYRRRCPSLAPGDLARRLGQWGIKIVLISSGEGLANMLELLSAEETTKFRGMRLVVPSVRVERLARQAGFSQILTAANASDGAMITALDEWIYSSGD
jgi:uroporphyrinogen-III synthase